MTRDNSPPTRDKVPSTCNEEVLTPGKTLVRPRKFSFFFLNFSATHDISFKSSLLAFSQLIKRYQSIKKGLTKQPAVQALLFSQKIVAQNFSAKFTPQS